MTQEEIVEGNKLIAEFMGFKPWVDFNIQLGFCELNINKYSTYEDGMGHIPHACTFKELRFHSSWDWLMPVIDKIGTILFEDNILPDYIDRSYVKSDCYENDTTKSILINLSIFASLEDVYEETIDFIKWYNEYNKT